MSLLVVVGILSVLGGINSVNQKPSVLFTFKPYEKDGVVYRNAKLFSDMKEVEEIITFIEEESLPSPLPDSPDSFAKGNAPNERGEGGYQIGDGVIGVGQPTVLIDDREIVQIHSSGNFYLYSPINSNLVYKIGLDSSGNHTAICGINQLDDQFYITQLLLVDDILAVIGFQPSNKIIPGYEPKEGERPYNPFPQRMYFLNANTLEVIKYIDFTNNFLSARVDNKTLYIISNRSIPSNRSLVNFETDFENVYYLNSTSNERAITRIDAFDLSSHNLESKTIGFLGLGKAVYMKDGLILITMSRWDSSGTTGGYRSTIIGVNYDQEANLQYVGSYEVLGYVPSEYFIDYYQDEIRVVTVAAPNKQNNSLYIFKIQPDSDEFKLVSYFNQDLSQRIEKVHFHEEIVKINTKSIITIDLSNSKKPKIIDISDDMILIDVLIPWNNEYSIGIGRRYQETGAQEALVINVYQDGNYIPIQTIIYDFYQVGFLYGEILTYPNMYLLIDREAGVFGFIMKRFDETFIQDGTKFSGKYSRVLLYQVDFNLDNPIKEIDYPPQLRFTETNPLKLLLINNQLHIIFREKTITWNINLKQFNQTIDLVKKEASDIP